MDVEAYKVSVRIALEDQITRGMNIIGQDVTKLNEKVKLLEKSLRGVAAAAKLAQKNLQTVASGSATNFTSATKSANEYARAMERAARASAASLSGVAASAGGGASLLPVLAGGAAGAAITGSAARAATAGMASRVAGNMAAMPLLMLPPGGSGSGGGRAWNGWSNGVPPGGWGAGRAGGAGGGIPPGSPPGGRGFGGGNHADAMINVGIGYLGLKLLGGFVDEAAKYQTVTEKFNQFGMGDAALADAEKFAQAQHIAGTSQREMMMKMVESQGVFRESGALNLEQQLRAAKLAAPVMAKMAFASQALDENAKAATHAKEMDMLRFVETAGGLKSPQRFNELMDAGFRAIQSSGGNVDFTQYRQFMAKAGTAAFGLTNEALFAKLEPIIGELKGSSAGDALMTSFNRLNGIVKLPNQVVRELMENGVWDGNKVELNKMGGVKRFTGNPLKESKMFSQDPVEFYEKVILPMYKKQNLSEDQIQRQNAMIFGRTGGKMFNLIDKQLQTIHHSIDSYNKSRGLDDAYTKLEGTYAGKKQILEASWHNFQLAMGKEGGVMDLAAIALDNLSQTLMKLTDLAQKNPDMAKLATNATLALASVALIGGGVAILTTALKALWDPLKLVMSGIEILAGSLLTLSGAIASLLVLIPTNNTPSTTDELRSIQSLGESNLQKNRARWKLEHPNGDPFPGDTIKYSGGKPVIVHSTINMDGRKVATATTRHQANDAVKALRQSTTQYDPLMTPPTVAAGR